MYQVIVPPKVIKEISKLDKRYRQAISIKIDSLSMSPLLGKKLYPPFVHLRSLRVGIYRIIYRVNKQNQTIYVSTAGHRGEVYNRKITSRT